MIGAVASKNFDSELDELWIARSKLLRTRARSLGLAEGGKSPSECAAVVTRSQNVVLTGSCTVQKKATVVIAALEQAAAWTAINWSLVLGVVWKAEHTALCAYNIPNECSNTRK